MSKKTKTPNLPAYADSMDRAPDQMTKGLRSTLLNPEAYIGQYCVVHSAPTAWIGCVVAIERRGEAIGLTLADAGLWISGELKEVIRPGLKAAKDTDSSHHHLVYVPIVTALQPAGTPSVLSWKAQDRGQRPGDPNNITLENYAEKTGQDIPTCIKALTNAHTAGAKGFESVVTMVSSYADDMAFPAPAVASLLITDALSRQW